MISGELVNSETSLTGSPAVRMALAVPPVESISTPAAASALASSMRPALSETESSARRIFGPPIVVTVAGALAFLALAAASAAGLAASGSATYASYSTRVSNGDSMNDGDFSRAGGMSAS